jgi:NADPH2:quinone reductase
MRAVLCSSWGEPSGLALGDLPMPEPGPGQVRLRVHAAGVNFADTLMIAGKYQDKPTLPFVPGLEAAGVVDAVGADVSGFKPGDRIIALPERGAFAEFALARAADCFAVPDAMPFDIAAGFPVTYGTAHGGLDWRARLKPGEWLLVHGAAGGVGLAVVEVGKAMGATVIATAGGPDKLAIARAHGADHLIDYAHEDIRARVKALTQDRGADVVFDPVGGDAFDASLRCINWDGRIVVVGFASGRVPQVPANILLVKNIAVIGLYWGAYRQREPARLRDSFRQLFAWYAEGRLKPHVSHRLDLAEAGRALDLLRQRKSTGKVVLTTGA